jgi:hypothetical protein
MRRRATQGTVGFQVKLGLATHSVKVRELQGYSITLDVDEALPRMGLTKVGFDALMETYGWFCSTRDGSSNTYYDLGSEPYLYIEPGNLRTEGALVRRLEDAYGAFQTA